jgi:ABC-type sugar transport system ATPase subunit
VLRSVRKPSTAAFATAAGPVGDHQMVEIAKTLLNDPRILIFDEPTALLSGEKVICLFTMLRSFGEKRLGIIGSPARGYGDPRSRES